MSVPVPAKYIADFERRGFGMFIHWGLYSQLAQGEWTMNLHHLSQTDYQKLFDQFTARDFDADKIVALAKKAGMKYITLTTRHHDGFSLYDTCGLTDYDVMHTPCGRDLEREFVEACRKNLLCENAYRKADRATIPALPGQVSLCITYAFVL